MGSTLRLGSNLKQVLKRRALSLKALSEQSGIPYSTLHTWLENRQPRDILKVKKLADFLGVTLQCLLFGEDDKNIDPPNGELMLRDGKSGEVVGVYEVVVTRRLK